MIYATKLIHMAKRPENLIYAVDEWPPVGKWLILGLQQFCIISIYLLLVVIVLKATGASHTVVQSGVSFAMIALAIGAVLQALWKGPIGSGYLAPPVASAIYLQPSLLAGSTGGLPLIFGMTIVAGLFESLISRFFYFLRSIFPPVVSGLIVVAVGFELGLIGTDYLLDVEENIHTESYQKHLISGTLTLALMVGFTIWGEGILRLISALVGMLTGWVVAAVFGLVGTDHLKLINESSYFAFPQIHYISYSFDLKLLIPFMIGGLAAGLRTIGVVTTCQRINDAEWRRPHKESIKKGMLADGLGCIVSGLLGATGLSSSPSAVGISEVTLATSRYIAFALAGWLILFSCIPKISALFIAIPTSVVGATLTYTGSLMLISGIQIITSRPLDIRKTFIVGISIFLGLSHRIFPAYFEQLPQMIRLFTGTILSITTLVSLLLNALFRIKSRETFNLTIDEDKKNLNQADRIIRDNVKKWGGNVEDAANVTGFVQSVCSLIEEGQYAQGPIRAKVSFDEAKLVIDIRYRGKLLHLPSGSPTQTHEDIMEEIPMAQGLSGFLMGVYPDRVNCYAKNDNCHLQLIFEI